MKIYFCGSIRGGRDDAEIYGRLIEFLKTYGEVLTEVVGDPTLTEEDRIEKEGEKWMFNRSMKWIKSSDVVIAEVTQTSIGVGMELGCAKMMGEKTLCLFRSENEAKRKLSIMVIGAEDEKFRVKTYSTIENAKDLIEEFLRLQTEESLQSH